MISCDDYDYIEIACMYRFPIKLTMKSGDVIEGVALDTQRDDEKRECIQLEIKGGGTTLVILDDIAKLEVTVENPHFKEVVFE